MEAQKEKEKEKRLIAPLIYSNDQIKLSYNSHVGHNNSSRSDKLVFVSL